MEQFFNAIRPLFNGKFTQAQVDGINAIIKASENYSIYVTAYCLATGYVETGYSMEPVKETVQLYHKNRNPTDATVAARLDSAFKKGLLKQVKTPYWRKQSNGQYYFGRGLVQLTHESNYASASKLIGVDLVNNPNKALDLDIAARILVEGGAIGLFTNGVAKWSNYLPESYIKARKVINGQDRAQEIAEYAKVFEHALSFMPPVNKNKPADTTKLEVKDQPKDYVPAQQQKQGVASLIVTAILRAFGVIK